jgi:hypothetical protein
MIWFLSWLWSVRWRRCRGSLADAPVVERTTRSGQHSPRRRRPPYSFWLNRRLQPQRTRRGCCRDTLVWRSALVGGRRRCRCGASRRALLAPGHPVFHGSRRLVVDNHSETLFFTWRCEESMHLVNLRFGDDAEKHAFRFQLISLSNSSFAGRVVNTHIVQSVVGVRALENRPYPLSVSDRVSGEVEHHRGAERQQSTVCGAMTLRSLAEAARYCRRFSNGSARRDVHSSSQISTARSVCAM